METLKEIIAKITKKYVFEMSEYDTYYVVEAPTLPHAFDRVARMNFGADKLDAEEMQSVLTQIERMYKPDLTAEHVLVHTNYDVANVVWDPKDRAYVLDYVRRG